MGKPVDIQIIRKNPDGSQQAIQDTSVLIKKGGKK